jgi:hypothetical protein
MTIQHMVERRKLIRQTIEEAMEEGVHYGIIPGTGDRMSLLKEGAEMLLSMFHIAVEPVVTDLSTATEVRFRVECRGTVNGMYVGSGIGICSSNEEKYRWRKPKSQAEYDDAEPTMRRIKYGISGGKEFKDRQVRQSPYDAIQTVLSMAEKRARVDLCKGALAASECLKGKKSAKWGNPRREEQKREPPPQTSSREGSATSGHAQGAASPAGSIQAQGPASAAKESEKPKAPALIQEDQVEQICRILDNAGIPDSAFLAAFEVGLVCELEATRYEAAMAWLQRNSP